MSFVINPFVFAGPALDPDAQAYIDAVELEDGQALEDGVRTAINDFVVGCKSDGIWSAIKAACILAGARTLDGALVPLVGSAPTNNNFVSGDYDRETGLKGNGSTKYLNSSRQENDEPQNSKHIAVNVTEAMTVAAGGLMGGLNISPLVGSQIYTDSTNGFFRCNGSSSYSLGSYKTQTGFIGTNRANSSQISYRLTGSTSTVSNSSAAGYGVDIHVFRRNWSTTNHTNARLSFYSIGESINLADLDSRVSTLMTDIATAIP